jgi:opacity protein-like surface antigen
MTDKMMDDLFRDKLERHDSAVPQGSFERIMAARDRKKRRPAGFWYLVPAALLVGGGLYFAARQSEPKPNTDMAEATGKTVLRPVDQDEGKAAVPAAQNNASLTKPSTTEKTFTLRSIPATSSHTPDESAAHVSKQRKRISEDPVVHDAAPENSGLVLVSSTPPASSSMLTRMSFPGLRTALNQGHDPKLAFRTDLPSTQRFCIPPCGIPGCPDFSEERSDWYVEAFGSADMPFKSLQDTRDKSGFVSHKDSTEHMLLSYSAGIRVSHNLTNNLLIKAGLHYAQINERFDYKNESEKKIVTVITIKTVIRGPGDTLLVRDTSQVETVGVRTKRTYNKYRNIDIPLILSWELRRPDYTIGLNGGLLFNVRSTFQGDMLDTSLVPMSQTTKTASSQVRTQWGLGLYAGVSFIKPVGENMDLFAEPWYRVYLKNVATDQAPFQQKMSAWGLQLGVRYRFNNGGQR